MAVAFALDSGAWSDEKKADGMKRGWKRETRTVPEDFYEVVETFFC